MCPLALVLPARRRSHGFYLPALPSVVPASGLLADEVCPVVAQAIWRKSNMTMLALSGKAPCSFHK